MSFKVDGEEKREIKTLGEICILITDGSHHSPASVEQGYFMASVKDMTEYEFNFNNCRNISEEDYNTLVKNGCKPMIGDILIGKDGARYLEDLFIYRQNVEVVVLSSIAILRVDRSKVLPEYLYYFLTDKEIKTQIKNNYGSGSAIPRMVLRDFKKVPVPVPQLNIQTAIATTLSCLDDMIELNNRTNKVLEEMAQTIFKRWFVDFEFPNEDGEPYKSSGGEMIDYELGKIPKGWRIAKLEDVLLEIEAGNRPKGGAGDLDSGIPSIGAENIIGLGEYDFSKEKYVPEEYFERMNKGIVNNWDVMLYKDGAQLGRKTMFAQDFPHKKCCINSHVFILRSNDLIIQPYLYFWLDQDYMTQNIINLNANSAQPGINQPAVKQLKILVPDKKTIIRFRDIVEKLLILLFENCKENRKLTILRNTLLPKLMSGEIRVPIEEVV